MLLMAVFVLSNADDGMTSSEENVEEWEDQVGPLRRIRTFPLLGMS